MKSEHWAIAASVLAGLSLAGFFAAPALLSGPPRDAETLCRKDGAVGHTVILVDKSDAWSDVQAQRLKALVKRVGDTLPPDRKLSIYVFQDAFEPNFPPLVALCNPGRTVSELIGNPRRDYVRWVEKFGRPLDQALTVLMQPTKGERSPIAEAIGDVLARPENRSVAGEKDLLLISDMLQNSPGFSFFGPGPEARDAERLKRVAGKVWQDADGAAWRLQVHQVQGVYDARRLEQASTLWQQALRALSIPYRWDRL